MTEFLVELASVFPKTVAWLGSSRNGSVVKDVGMAEAMGYVVTWARYAREAGNKMMFVGNGGSAAVASHMAIDWQNTADIRAMCFNDAAALTCLSNDYGFDDAFAVQVTRHADAGDVLFAFSSSGNSPNVVEAVKAARAKLARVVTFTGFDHDNEVRGLGTLNFWVPSRDYGVVECAYLALAHAALSETVRTLKE